MRIDRRCCCRRRWPGDPRIDTRLALVTPAPPLVTPPRDLLADLAPPPPPPLEREADLIELRPAAPRPPALVRPLRRAEDMEAASRRAAPGDAMEPPAAAAGAAAAELDEDDAVACFALVTPLPPTDVLACALLRALPPFPVPDPAPVPPMETDRLEEAAPRDRDRARMADCRAALDAVGCSSREEEEAEEDDAADAADEAEVAEPGAAPPAARLDGVICVPVGCPCPALPLARRAGPEEILKLAWRPDRTAEAAEGAAARFLWAEV